MKTSYRIDFRPFFQQIALTPLSPWLETLPQLLKDWQQKPHGYFDKWQEAIFHAPDHLTDDINLKDKVQTLKNVPLTSGEKGRLLAQLNHLKPWKKGPFHLFDIHIDSEWRSDLKWDRLLPHISPLKDRTILDVGCGNGYHMWRMVGEGAKMVVGIDPTALFLCQFEMIRKLLNNDRRANLIPLGIEEMQPLNAFDTVFSMGVLYHRKSPLEHLMQLRSQLAEGGELVLETLVIDGDENSVLVPVGRYAKMKNVYFIPSVKAMILWLEKVGFKNVKCVDVCDTTEEEQRSTEWSSEESLKDFLDPMNPSLTIEGLPAPKRAVFLATK